VSEAPFTVPEAFKGLQGAGRAGPCSPVSANSRVNTVALEFDVHVHNFFHLCIGFVRYRLFVALKIQTGMILQLILIPLSIIVTHF